MGPNISSPMRVVMMCEAILGHVEAQMEMEREREKIFPINKRG